MERHKKTKKKRNKAKSLLIQTGVTPDNKMVMGGCFAFYETYGVPLNIFLMCCVEHNWIPDWIDFYLSALSAGMEHGRILSKLEEAINDSFGKEFCDVVIDRLDKMYKERKS